MSLQRCKGNAESAAELAIGAGADAVRRCPSDSYSAAHKTNFRNADGSLPPQMPGVNPSQ